MTPTRFFFRRGGGAVWAGTKIANDILGGHLAVLDWVHFNQGASSPAPAPAGYATHLAGLLAVRHTRPLARRGVAWRGVAWRALAGGWGRQKGCLS